MLLMSKQTQQPGETPMRFTKIGSVVGRQWRHSRILPSLNSRLNVNRSIVGNTHDIKIVGEFLRAVEPRFPAVQVALMKHEITEGGLRLENRYFPAVFQFVLLAGVDVAVHRVSRNKRGEVFHVIRLWARTGNSKLRTVQVEVIYSRSWLVLLPNDRRHVEFLHVEINITRLHADGGSSLDTDFSKATERRRPGDIHVREDAARGDDDGGIDARQFNQHALMWVL